MLLFKFFLSKSDVTEYLCLCGQIMYTMLEIFMPLSFCVGLFNIFCLIFALMLRQLDAYSDQISCSYMVTLHL